MFDQIIPGIYYPGASVLHRLGARAKLLALAWLVGFVAAANRRAFDPWPYAALLSLVFLAAALSGSGPRLLWRRMRLIALLAALGAIPVTLLGDSDERVLYALGPLLITAESVWLAGRLVVTLLSLYALALLMTMTTSPVALIEGLTRLLGPLRRLRLPVDEFALMALLALRFVPTLGAEIETLVKAQLARGADFAHGPPRERVQSLAALIVPVFQAVWRRAEALATALDARGYAADARPTPLYETRLGQLDYAALAVILAVTIGSLLI